MLLLVLAVVMVAVRPPSSDALAQLLFCAWSAGERHNSEQQSCARPWSSRCGLNGRHPRRGGGNPNDPFVGADRGGPSGRRRGHAGHKARWDKGEARAPSPFRRESVIQHVRHCHLFPRRPGQVQHVSPAGSRPFPSPR